MKKNSSEYDMSPNLFYGVFNFNNIFESIYTCVIYLIISGWSSINDIVIKIYFFNIYLFSIGKVRIEFLPHFTQSHLFSLCKVSINLFFLISIIDLLF